MGGGASPLPTEKIFQQEGKMNCIFLDEENTVCYGKIFNSVYDNKNYVTCNCCGGIFEMDEIDIIAIYS